MILNPQLTPTVGIPQAIVAPSRRRRFNPTMANPAFYQQQLQQPSSPGAVTDSQQATQQQQTQFEQPALTGEYIAQQLQALQARAAPPMLEPGARVRAPNSELVAPSNFQQFYERLGIIDSFGIEMEGAAKAKAAYKKQQELNAIMQQQVKGFNLPTLQQSGGGGNQDRYTGPVGKGVQQWANVTLEAMKMLGIPEQYLNTILRRMNQESGGNPNAINNWDSNAKKGTPSKGLMQTIDPTFNSYAGNLKGRGVYDPLANIYAGLNYAGQRYGKTRGGFLAGVLYAMNKPGGY